MLETNINVKTDQFDGPLSLLLLLIEKDEMNIRNLDLTVITRQYLEYLAHMKELNFDIAGDYLFLAATLLLLKSKTCVEEEEISQLKEHIEGRDGLVITSQAELIRRLEELKMFQGLGQKLWELPKKGHEVFTKQRINRKEIINSILTPMDLDKLTTSMMDFLQKEKRKFSMVRRDRLSIKEKLKFLKEYLQEGKTTLFSEILSSDGDHNVDNIVITFISLLELARLGKVSIYQNESVGSIYVDVLESFENFDVTIADGFDDERDDDKNGLEIEQLISDGSATESPVEEHS